METTNLLNIKSTASHSTDVITGQALAMVTSDKNKTNAFKSAFKTQMDSNKNDVQKNKDLPQNGKELPKKKVAADKQEKVEQSEKNDQQTKNVENNNLQQADDGSIKEPEQVIKGDQANSHEQQVSKADQENSQESIQSDKEDNHFEPISSSEKSLNETALQAPIEETTIENVDPEQDVASQQEQVVINNAQAISESSHQESISAQQLNNNVPNNVPNTIINPDGLHSDKKAQTELVKGQVDLAQSSSNGPSISQTATAVNASSFDSNSGFNSKNESPLTKSIAEFQQFIEMSKKHSMAGDSIASVKSFEQNLKNTQLNAQLNAQINNQLLQNDAKLSAAQASSQGVLSTQATMQAAPLDKLNSSFNNNALSFLKTASGMEVKTAVGKPGWNKNFSNQIIMMANNGVQQAKIKLNPMSLGPVEAMVKLSGETAVVSLTSLHLTTKDALENAIPRLKEMLNENGFSQVDVNVSHQDKQQQQEAALNTGSNNEHGNSTMPGDEQLSEETSGDESDVQAADSDEQGLNIVDYYA